MSTQFDLHAEITNATTQSDETKKLVFLFLVYGVFTTGITFSLPENQRITAIGVSVMAIIFMVAFSAVALTASSSRTRRKDMIIPDATLERIANSLTIPEDVKRQIAIILRANGVLRLSDLHDIDALHQAATTGPGAEALLRYC